MTDRSTEPSKPTKGVLSGAGHYQAAPINDAFIAYTDEFFDVLGSAPRLVKVVEVDAHKGSVYVKSEDALYFTTLPAPMNIPLPNYHQVAIKRLALNGDQFPVGPDRLSVVSQSTNMANGMTLDRKGHLVICE